MYFTFILFILLASFIFKFAKLQDPIIGGSLLLTYTTGYVAPLLLAAAFAGALQVYMVLYWICCIAFISAWTLLSVMV